jgi:hypothetical protein
MVKLNPSFKIAGIKLKDVIRDVEESRGKNGAASCEKKRGAPN